MIKVECDACKSPYQIEERRIPAAGLKMRCSKCGSSILVQKPGTADASPPDLGEVDLPMPAAPRPKGGTEPLLPKPKLGGPVTPAPPPAVKPQPPKPPATPAKAAPDAKPTTQLGKAKAPAAIAPPKEPSAANLPAAAEEMEVDLPLPAFGEIDLPSPAKPTVRKMAPVTPNEDREVRDLPALGKATVRQMAAPVHESLDLGEQEEDAALNAIEMAPAPSPAPGRTSPQDKPTVRQMAASEPEGFEIDLPAAAKPSPAKPSPAKPPPAIPAKPAKPAKPAPTDQKPTTPARPAAKGFGEIDLPSPAKPARGNAPKPDADLDLPEAKGFGDIDLPAPAKPAAPKPAKPKEEADLPAAKGFGDIDLPAPAKPTAPKAAQPKEEADLPAAKGFGEIDLPAAAPAPRAAMKSATEADLPVALTAAEPSGMFGAIELPEIDLPNPEGGEFGEYDLPPGDHAAAFQEMVLPLPQGEAQEPSAPAARADAAGDELSFADFGEIDLPLASEPPPPGPAPAKFAPAAPPKTAAPAHSTSGSFALDHAFDATFGPSLDTGAVTKPSADAHAAPKPSPAVGSGEEFSLSDAGIELGDGLADAHAPPASVPRRISEPPPRTPLFSDPSAAVGDEVDLEPGDAAAMDAAARRDKLTKTGRTGLDAAKVEPTKKPQKSRARMYVIVGAVLFAIGGGSLSLLPDIGPFGAHFIADKINAPRDAEALKEAEKRVQALFDEDTFAASKKALDAIKATSAERPRHRPTAAYTAFTALMRGVRHGRRGDDETFAKQLLAQQENAESRELSLARAAQHALGGKLDAARRVAKAAASEAPNDIDAACLLAEVELLAGTKEALDLWKKAASIKQGARTLYGLARAELAAGDAAAAEKDAQKAIELSPKHASARVLLASILGRDAKREAEAVALLKKVTDEGEVRSAANDGQIVAAFVELGRVHLARSRVSAAEEAFAAALKMDPRSVSALLGDAELFFRSGRYSQALLRFEEAMKADDANVSAKIGAGKTMLELGRMKDAKELFAAMRTQKPDAPLAAYWLGRAEDALGNKKDAETLYRDAIKLAGTTPEAVDAYVALAALLSALGKGEDAQAVLAEASAKFTDLAALHRAKGDVLLAQGRYAEARTELETALAKEDDLGTRFRLGITTRRMRDFEAASKIFDELAALDKDYPSLALERGLLYEETGQSEKALAMYGEALKKAPNDVDLKLRVGSTQVIAGHADQAETILREVIKERAGSADANHFLGRALLLKGNQAAEAIRFLNRAVEIDGNRAEYYLYVAWAANELGQWPRAEQAINKALELDHELADAYWQRGVLYSKQGRIKDALVDLETALAKRPSRFEAYATMAVCHQELGQQTEAIADWQKAIAGNNSVAEWQYRLGKLYDGQGSTLLAMPYLEKAVELLDAKPSVMPGWPADAYFLYAEAVRGIPAKKEAAIKAYKRFMELAPVSNAYRADAERALKQLGALAP